MKKLKKLSVLVLLAAGFALAFSGCSNTKDETGTEQGGEAGSGGETGGTGGSNDGTENPGDSGSSGDNTGSNGDATGSGGDNSSGGQTNNGDNTGNSGEGTVKAEAVTIVKKGEYKVKVDNKYSQAYINVTGDDKAITKGDLLIVGGTVDAGQVGIKQIRAQINYGSDDSDKILQFDNYYDGSSKEKTVKYYKVVRATEDFTISSIQISVEPLAVEQEATLKDFYIMRLPAADLDELAPGVFKEKYTLEPKDSAGKYDYESTLDITSAIKVKKGDILYASYTRSEIDVDWCNHYFQFVDGDSDNWSKGSGFQHTNPSKAAGTVTLTYNASDDFTWNKTQIGIQQQSSSKPEKGLEITNLSLRVLPSF